jgi:2-dehydro-3-deoxyphosphooctonate aldolase (KDO 8-P synthase)
MKSVKIKNFNIGKNEPLTFICGPCVIESEYHTLKCAEYLKELFNKSSINFIFKSSFDKANRSHHDSFRGPGLDLGLKILQKVKEQFDLPVTSDIHWPHEVESAKDVLDILQIPAFLCRQTDLIISAAKSLKPINIKKGQFMAPWDMENVVEKIRSQNNDQIILTDRGTSFGYNNLVSDFRSIPIMQDFGHPVCFDATHSVQLPGGNKTTSGGQRQFIPVLAKAAIAAGANCIFMEAHPEPKTAKSDASSVMDFNELDHLVKILKKLYEVTNERC